MSTPSTCAYTPPQRASSASTADLSAMLPSERRAFLLATSAQPLSTTRFGTSAVPNEPANGFHSPRFNSAPSSPASFLHHLHADPIHDALTSNLPLTASPLCTTTNPLLAANHYDVDFFSTPQFNSTNSLAPPSIVTSSDLIKSRLLSPSTKNFPNSLLTSSPPLLTLPLSAPDTSLPPNSTSVPNLPDTSMTENQDPPALHYPTNAPPSSILRVPNLDLYAIERIIGRGAFSKIQLANHRHSHAKVAIKLVDTPSSTSVAQHMAEVEASVFRLINNQCSSIVHCYEVLHGHEVTDVAGLVLEYCPGGDLFDLLAYRHSELSMIEAARIAWQLCSAVTYLHDYNIVHRDLKLENILLTSISAPFSIKLSDFGLARILTGPSELISTRAGTEEYLAPEVIILTDKPYAPKPADMWSVGVILYAVLVGQLPFAQEAKDVVVVEQVAVVPEEMDCESSKVLKNEKPGLKRASALLKHLETKLSFTTLKPRVTGSVPELPLICDLPPTPTTPTLQILDGSSSPQCASPKERSLESSPRSSICSTPVKVVRRRSTRRAGRKALWHRIARAEFYFPDEVLEGTEHPPMPENSSLFLPSSSSALFPLLTVETKAIVRGLLDPQPGSRLTARECSDAVPWIVSGRSAPN